MFKPVVLAALVGATVMSVGACDSGQTLLDIIQNANRPDPGPSDPGPSMPPDELPPRPPHSYPDAGLSPSRPPHPVPDAGRSQPRPPRPMPDAGVAPTPNPGDDLRPPPPPIADLTQFSDCATVDRRCETAGSLAVCCNTTLKSSFFFRCESIPEGTFYGYLTEGTLGHLQGALACY